MRPARLLILRRWVTTLVAVLFAFGMQGAFTRQLRCARAHAVVRTQQVTPAPSAADALAAPAVASDAPPGSAPLDDSDGASPCAPAIAALPAESVVGAPPVAWEDVHYPGRAPPRRVPTSATPRLERPPRA